MGRLKAVPFCCALVFSTAALSAQSSPSLRLSPNDIRLVPDQRGGYGLYVRKIEGAGSIVLFEFPEDPENLTATFPYRSRSPVNGFERALEPGSRIFMGGGIWLLADSLAEEYPGLPEIPLWAETFRVYIPPVMDYGFSDSRSGIATTEKPLPVNIRVYARPYGDEGGGYMDNPFILWNDTLIPYAGGRFDAALARPRAQEPILPGKEPPFTLDLSAGGGLMFFSPGPEGKINESVQILSNFNPVAKAALRASLTRTVQIIAGFDRDNVLLNRLYTRAALDFSFLSLEAGLFTGLFNFDAVKVRPGFSAALNLTMLRGMFTGSLAFDYAINRALDTPGDYSQDALGLELRFLLQPLSLALLFSSKTLMMKSEGAMVSHYWSRYVLKTTPRLRGSFGFSLDLGYQKLMVLYTQFGVEEYSYATFFAGLEFSLSLPANLELSLGLEAPVYPFVYPRIGSLSDPEVPLLCGVSLGLRYSL
jgi:hypothetical protein